ncbi:MAG: tRNA guanosine(34) transglycosylase Tgt [Dehalococcoidia bacterium]
MTIGFEVSKSCPHSGARAAMLTTPHGVVPTPTFIPVGTQATVKSLTPEELLALGAKIVLGNTYHLYLRPGIGVIEKLGGLHRFMGWHGPLITDSGGYQVFSLARLRQLSDDGVLFRSHIDGSEHFLTPELCVQFQEALGADIIMALDECPPYSDDLDAVRGAMERTHRWAQRCQKSQRRQDQALYGILQGGVFRELRRQSANFLTSLGFQGYAIGGLSLGEPKEVTKEVVEETVALLPEDKPRYLMGVGSPDDLFEGVSRGIDIFDSALPTRIARNGGLFTHRGRTIIRNACYLDRDSPIQDGCDCYTCQNFSAAYLHHLFKCEELLAYRLATLHNLRFVIRLMEEMRKHILDGTFLSFKDSFFANYEPTDEETRSAQRQKWMESRETKFNQGWPGSSNRGNIA